MNNSTPSYITTSEARRHIGENYGVREPTAQTFWRWYTLGVRGAILQTVTMGQTVLTTEEWIEEFFVAQNRGRTFGTAHDPDYETPAEKAENEAAEEELRRRGLPVGD